MGLRSLLKKKAPEDDFEPVVGSGRAQKFEAYGEMAKQKERKKYAPANGDAYAPTNELAPAGGNPYATASGTPNPYGAPNPYGNPSHNQPPAFNPHRQPAQAYPARAPAPSATLEPYKPKAPAPRATVTPQQANPYATSARSGNPYGPPPSDYEPSLDLNAEDLNAEDLNEAPDNYDNEEEALRRQAEMEEEEEVEQIKQEMRFTKQQTILSTRNMVNMGQQALNSADNALGMMGSQSERLFESEDSLRKMDQRNYELSKHINQIHRYRGMLTPMAANPFNGKVRRRREDEEWLNKRMEQKTQQEAQRSQIADSQRRLGAGLEGERTGAKPSKPRSRNYRRHQFEADSEDDEMEAEIDDNLAQVGEIVGKLSLKARTMGTEMDKQNDRLRQLEEGTDRIELNVSKNTRRLDRFVN